MGLHVAVLSLFTLSQADADPPRRFYAHEAVTDAHGVIAPWYQGQNGQLDLRVRIAAETMKRYPWALPPGMEAAPHYVFSGAWAISPQGEITIPPIGAWDNGDLGQRAAYVLSGLVDYYRYSGDPAAIAHLTLMADHLLDHCLTPPDHAWPRFLISVPNRGVPYGGADPHGFIQLDITAEVGIGLVRAYQLTGNRRWLEAAKHWADVLAEHADLTPGAVPWGRYANPEDVPWEDLQTGGVVFILAFFDELLKLDYPGRQPGSIPAAVAAGEAYLRDALLPRWTADDTWGRNYWDWNDPVQAENVTEFAVRYIMEHPRRFPGWRTACRNIMSLFLNRTSVSPASNGDVYQGAWAYPESSGCCGRSLWYGPMELATVYAQYAALTRDEWAREMARRQIILATYDVHETGVVEDNIDGGQIVAGAWFKIAHPMALKHCLGVIGWMPELFAPARENHIVRSSGVVRDVTYADGLIKYTTFDARPGCHEALRLAFEPAVVLADGEPLEGRGDLLAPGYVVQALRGGDFLLTVRHDGARHMVILGDDPQETTDDAALIYEGEWAAADSPADFRGTCHTAHAKGAAVTARFVGNQVRLIGRVGPTGGLADVLLDGQRQLVGVDCWSPQSRRQQVLYCRNGLAQGEHELRIVARGEGNAVSAGAAVWVDAVQWSAAIGEAGFGEGGGPTGPQRVVFGYAARRDYADSQGNLWRPATEFVVRAGDLADVVKLAWWTEPRAHDIGGTPDPELYRYGVHARTMTTYFTVGPGTYHVRLKFAETRAVAPMERAVSLAINDKEVLSGLDIAATAGGMRRAADLVFEDVTPVNGIIAVRLWATYGGEAIIQAAEVGPGPGGAGMTPVLVSLPSGEAVNLLTNPGFETTVAGTLGRAGTTVPAAGWTYLFASPSQSYIWGESDYARHPDWGLPEYHGGRQALRTHTDGNGHTIIYQDAPALPRTTYRASAWVRCADLAGKGFGAQPGDRASLVIHELGPCGAVLTDHGGASATKPGPYVKLEKTFTTGDKAAKVRFMLDNVIACPYNAGHVTWDDCALVRVGQ